MFFKVPAKAAGEEKRRFLSSLRTNSLANRSLCRAGILVVALCIPEARDDLSSLLYMEPQVFHAALGKPAGAVPPQLSSFFMRAGPLQLPAARLE
jgi:hypothetical protein